MRKHFITRMAGMVMAGLMTFSMSAPVMAEEAAAEETTDDAAEGTISVYIDKIASNKKVGEITVNANKDYQYFKTKLTKTVTGKHKVFFKFSVKGILVDTWMFSKEEEPQEP